MYNMYEDIIDDNMYNIEDIIGITSHFTDKGCSCNLLCTDNCCTGKAFFFPHQCPDHFKGPFSFSAEVERQQVRAEPPPTCSAEVRNKWALTHTPSRCCHGAYWDNIFTPTDTDSFTHFYSDLVLFEAATW